MPSYIDTDVGYSRDYGAGMMRVRGSDPLPRLEKTALAQVDLDDDIVDGGHDERERARVCRVGVVLVVSSGSHDWGLASHP